MRILAFDIGGTNIKYAICDEKFNLTDRHTVPTEAQKGRCFLPRRRQRGKYAKYSR